MTDAFDIPDEAVGREPMASRHRDPVEQEAILRDALLAAGVELGSYDERIVNWFAQFADWGTFATITSWVKRAASPVKAELEHARMMAADATEYRIHLPENGGTTLFVKRQSGVGWAVSVPGYGGGRAWTTEGWQESISALSVDRLFCWPDAATAANEARRALAT